MKTSQLPPQSESKIQTQIVQYLQLKKIFFFSVPNEAAGRSKIAQMQLVAMGLRAGAADLVLFYPAGKVSFMEVKTEKGKQSKRQENFQRRCEDHGLFYGVVRNLDDVDEFLCKARLCNAGQDNALDI